MRRTSLYFLSFFFLISTNFVLLGDYHIGYGGGEPPRDPVQDVRDRCNVNGGSSPEMQRRIEEEHMQRVDLRYVCSEVVYYNGIRFTQSPGDIVKRFCGHQSTQKYMDFVDWSTAENSLYTARELKRRIDEKTSRGKKLRRYLKKVVNQGRAGNYFEKKHERYIEQLYTEVCKRERVRIRALQKKNYKEILQVHLSQTLGGDDLSKKKLVDYGEKQLEKFEDNDTARERLDRVIKTLQNNGAVREKRYQTGEKLKSHGKEYGISPDDIELFSGNELQHYFYEQVINSLDRSFAIAPSNVKTLSIGSIKCAYAANISHEYELFDASLGFSNSLLYLAKRAGSGVLAGGIDFGRAVAFLLGSGELPRDKSSISGIFAKIKEQPLQGVGDGLEYAIRTVTFGGAVLVSYLLGLEVAAVGVGAAKGIVAATQFLKPFSVGISPSGAATIERTFVPAADFVQASVIELGQVAQSICGIAEQCGHLFAAAKGGPPGGGVIDEIIQLSEAKFGHTFPTHGADKTDFLIKRAQGSGQAQGQFLDNQKAAKFILDNLDKAKNGSIDIKLPEGFSARVIMPDGSFVSATHVRIVPSGNYVKTAYPLIL